MASRQEHNHDCKQLLGYDFNEVNAWLDKLFSLYGPLHRPYRHHWQGIQAVGIDLISSFNSHLGRKAAIVHILKDCGHIPNDFDYKSGVVDQFGILKTSSFSGYWLQDVFILEAQRILKEYDRTYYPNQRQYVKL